MKERIFGGVSGIALLVALYQLWFMCYPEITSEFWQGFALLAFIILTPLYLILAWCAFWFGVLKK